jgi:HD superfamily phosphohydrolase
MVHTIVAVPPTEEGGPRIGVTEGGWHAAEGLIVARYFMFTQVYFHKTRIIYDHHLQKALADVLPGKLFPKPTGAQLDRYLSWTDWRVLGLLARGKGGEHGRRLAGRDHYREVIHTPETPTRVDLDRLNNWRHALGDLLAAEIPAEKSWYKAGATDVQVLTVAPKPEVKPLSTYSSVVRSIEPIRQVRLYVRPEHIAEATALVATI